MCLQDRKMGRATGVEPVTTAALGSGGVVQMFKADMRRVALMLTCVWEPTSIAGNDVVFFYAGSPVNGVIIAVVSPGHPVERLTIDVSGDIITAEIWAQSSPTNAQNMTPYGLSTFSTQTDAQLAASMG